MKVGSVRTFIALFSSVIACVPEVERSVAARRVANVGRYALALGVAELGPGERDPRVDQEQDRADDESDSIEHGCSRYSLSVSYGLNMLSDQRRRSKAWRRSTATSAPRPRTPIRMPK